MERKQGNRTKERRGVAEEEMFLLDNSPVIITRTNISCSNAQQGTKGPQKEGDLTFYTLLPLIALNTKLSEYLVEYT